MSVQQCVCLLGAESECPTHNPKPVRTSCTCLNGEWNPVCRVHPPVSDTLSRPARTPLRFPQKVSHDDFNAAMRLLKADRTAEGLHLITLHIENGNIEATYAEVHRIGLIAEVQG